MIWSLSVCYAEASVAVAVATLVVEAVEIWRHRVFVRQGDWLPLVAVSLLQAVVFGLFWPLIAAVWLRDMIRRGKIRANEQQKQNDRDY